MKNQVLHEIEREYDRGVISKFEMYRQIDDFVRWLVDGING